MALDKPHFETLVLELARRDAVILHHYDHTGSLSDTERAELVVDPQADGADQLTGYGDLLYKDVGEPVRLQAPYLEPEDRANVSGGRGL